MKHVGDPTPRAPSNVIADRSYRVVDSRHDVLQASGGSQTTLVVFHLGTETYWQATYITAVGHLPTSWCQVKPERVTSVVYREIS